MKVYKVRNKETGEFLLVNKYDRRHTWTTGISTVFDTEVDAEAYMNEHRELITYTLVQD